MLSTFYNVSISQIAGTANAAGFVDSLTVEKYMGNNGGVTPSSLTNSANKIRANIRYKNIVETLQLMGNVYMSNTIATGADVNNAASNFSFTLESERGDETLSTVDENNTANTLTGAAAIARCVARGLIEFRAGYVYPVFDPTASVPQGPANFSNLANALVRVGSTTMTLNVDGLGANVASVANSITVTQIVI